MREKVPEFNKQSLELSPSLCLSYYSCFRLPSLYIHSSSSLYFSLYCSFTICPLTIASFKEINTWVFSFIYDIEGLLVHHWSRKNNLKNNVYFSKKKCQYKWYKRKEVFLRVFLFFIRVFFSGFSKVGFKVVIFANPAYMGLNIQEKFHTIDAVGITSISNRIIFQSITN